MNDGGGRDPLAILLRWEDSGGTWRVLSDNRGRVDLELLTCDGCEVMAHVRTDDPAVLAHVRRAEQP